jgi:hypothetical protein
MLNLLYDNAIHISARGAGELLRLHSLSADGASAEKGRGVGCDAMKSLGRAGDGIDLSIASSSVQRHGFKIARHRTQRRVGAEQIDWAAFLVSDHGLFRSKRITSFAARDAVVTYADPRTSRSVDMKNVRQSSVTFDGIDDTLLVIRMGTRFVRRSCICISYSDIKIT